MNVGYVRVSSKDQNPERQIEKMKSLMSDERFLFVEKESGKNFTDRPKYQAMKLALREGDVLYVDSIDRLGRNYEAVKEEWRELTRQIKADVVALDMPDLFDSRKFKEQGEVGKLLEDQMLSLLAWVADQERQKIRKRQKEGIAIAKEKGAYKGRKEIPVGDMFFAVTKMWVDGQISLSEAQERLGMAPATFFRKCKKYGIKKQDRCPRSKGSSDLV